jgi:RNA polymerase sigma factor (sigma-70 family)
VDKLSDLLRGLASARRGELTDGELLERFVASRDEAAFECLVHRHGPMVMGVCRRVLGHADAEDAFQATFLVLARKAATIRPRGHVAAWLHAVARRTAAKARGAALRRAGRERQLERLPEPAAPAPAGCELPAQVDEELGRLPERYRMAILLCGIEGRSYRDAARQLGCAEGTVGSWLCRAREMLAARLCRRGLAVPAGALAAALAQSSVRAAPGVARAASRAACLFASGQAAGVAAPGAVTLAEGVLSAMLSSKLKVASAVLLALFIAAGGICSLRAARRPDAVPPLPAGPRAAVAPDNGLIAAPPAKDPPDLPRLIDQLGDDDAEVREKAETKIDALGEAALPALRRAGKAHADPDVRLAAVVLARKIDRRLYGVLRRFSGHEGGVVAFALSPDARRMVSTCWANKDGNVRVWEVGTGKELFQLTGHPKRVFSVAWSADGKRIATGCENQVRLFDAEAGKELIKPLTVPLGFIYNVALTPKGDRVVVCGTEKKVFVFDLDTGKEVSQNQDSDNVVRGLAMMPDGKSYACSSFDGGVRVIDVATGKLVRKMDETHARPDGAWFVAVSKDGKRLASSGGDGTLLLHEVATGKLLKKFEGNGRGAHGIAISPDGKRLLSGSYDKTARLWDVGTGEAIQTMDDHGDVVSCVAFLPDGRRALTSCFDRQLRIWKLRE